MTDRETNLVKIEAAAPHIRGRQTTRGLMGSVVLALMPALVWAVFVFGWRALVITAVSVVTCAACETVWCVARRQKNTIGDLSCVVTGVLLAYTLPVSAPLHIPVLGGAFAIIVVKCLYGGLGKNVVNPALAGRAFIVLSFPGVMARFIVPAAEKLPPFSLPASIDALAGSTPLVSLKQGYIPENLRPVEVLFGQMGGCIGEVSALLLIAGGLYLLVKRVITLEIPLGFIGTVALVTYFFPRNPSSLYFMMYEVLSGGLILGAVFMATDYATAPVTRRGKLLYGVGCGLLTVFIRYFGSLPEGVMFAILTMNLLVWYIDRLTRPAGSRRPRARRVNAAVVAEPEAQTDQPAAEGSEADAGT